MWVPNKCPVTPRSRGDFGKTPPLKCCPGYCPSFRITGAMFADPPRTHAFQRLACAEGPQPLHGSAPRPKASEFENEHSGGPHWPPSLVLSATRVTEPGVTELPLSPHEPDSKALFSVFSSLNTASLVNWASLSQGELQSGRHRSRHS